jgi:hypothetical protein
MVAESPRWLHRRGRIADARAALLRSRPEATAEAELEEMNRSATADRKAGGAPGGRPRDSLLRRKYVVPFALACIILACNQATGINSIIGYNTAILLQAGLTDVQAHWGYVILTLTNFLLTMVGVFLVDRIGRKMLLSVGSAGIILSLAAVGVVFRSTEKLNVDCRDAVQSNVSPSQTATIRFDADAAKSLLHAAGHVGGAIERGPVTLIVIYSYAGFRAATSVVRSDDESAPPISISRDGCVPSNGVVAFFSNPFASLREARMAPLRIERALVTPVPSEAKGWVTAGFIFCFIAFFAVGPGVCVWLALSELMPTRIRSNGMSAALLVNQAVSTLIAASFLPAVGRFGYSAAFFSFAACTVIYFVTATFFLPETKGKTLEEIERHFEGF